MKRNFIVSTFGQPGLLKGLTIATLILLCCSSCIRPPHHSAVTTQNVHTAASQSDSHARINLNNASVAELQQLPGVGKILAERIVEYRAKYGPFRRTEHLLLVRGISERKFRELEMMIAVE